MKSYYPMSNMHLLKDTHGFKNSSKPIFKVIEILQKLDDNKTLVNLMFFIVQKGFLKSMEWCLLFSLTWFQF